jgi:phage gp29-like protein
MSDAPSDLKKSVATTATDPFRWWYGGRIQSDDQVLASRGQGKGLWLYDELTRDPKVGAVLDKRKMAIVGREWELEPANQSAAAKEVMAFVQRVLVGLRFNQVVAELLEATLKGISVSEIVWTATGAGIVPDRIIGRDPRRFAFVDQNGTPELKLLTREAPIDGIALPARKFIVHRHGGRYGSPWGLGLGQRLFWPVFFKRQGIGFWLSAVEKFAAPTPLGKYPPGTSEADQAKLLEAMAAIAREAAGVVPEGMLVELIEAKRAGAFDTYEKLARYMDEDISITVLGETLTTSAGEAGSRALGEVHNEVRLELVKADADALSDTLNATLIRWLVDLNMPGAPAPRLWWNFEAPHDLTARADRDVHVAQIGFRPTLEYIREHYGQGWE